jgi:hypothetical protein
MSNQIKPALTPEEWAREITISEANDRYDVRAVIAIANDLLDEADPGKITREIVTRLRAFVGVGPEDDDDVAAFQRLAGALESYLRPGE